MFDMCFGPQMNRCVMCLAMNALFTEDPAKDPALYKMLQAVGLDGTKPILHCEHPVVTGTEQLLPSPPPQAEVFCTTDQNQSMPSS